MRWMMTAAADAQDSALSCAAGWSPSRSTCGRRTDLLTADDGLLRPGQLKSELLLQRGNCDDAGAW